MATAKERLEKKIERIPGLTCWVWIGASKPTGYGNFNYKGRFIGAHVASYLIHKGEVNHLYVCHTCDNPWCVNPDHLFLGTQEDNMDDMSNKDRSAFVFRNGMFNPMYGKKHSEEAKTKMRSRRVNLFSKENHPRASITIDIAEKIKAMRGENTAKAVSETLNVSIHVVRNIWNGKSWR